MRLPKWIESLKESAHVNAEMRRRQRDLNLRVKLFNARDRQAERALWDARVNELTAAISATNPKQSYNATRIVAEERASIEQFAQQRIQLPTGGLDELAPDLEREGFYFGEGNRVLTLVYFPEGWEIVPAEAPMGSGLNSSHAYLVDPSGERRAAIFFRSSITGDSWKGHTSRL